MVVSAIMAKAVKNDFEPLKNIKNKEKRKEKAMRKIGLILLALVVLLAVLAAPAMAGSRHRDYHRDYKFDWRPMIILPPVIIIHPPIPYPNYPPPRGYYGGHWETRWEWNPYSQRWYQTRVWVDDYPYYGHPRRW